MAKFLPTNSGTIVQARAQVLIGSRLPVLSARYTFSSSRSSTYGPFFNERPMVPVLDPLAGVQAVEVSPDGPAGRRCVLATAGPGCDDGRPARQASRAGRRRGFRSSVDRSGRSCGAG